MPRYIAHLDMDAFYASVELLRYPDLRGQPVVIGGGHRHQPELLADGTRRYARLVEYAGRGVITTATYEARALGVHSGMGLMKAAALAPEVVLLPTDFDEYRRYSRLFKAAVAEIAPQIEDRGIDEAYIDLTDVPGAQDAVGGDPLGGVRLRVVIRLAQGKEAIPKRQPKRGTPWPGKADGHRRPRPPRRLAVAHHGPQQHHTRDRRRPLVRGPQCRAGGERVAQDHRRAGLQMRDQGQRIVPDGVSRIVVPRDRRLTVTTDVHRHHPVAGTPQQRPQGAVFVAQIAHAGDGQHQRPGSAGIVIGDPAVGQRQVTGDGWRNGARHRPCPQGQGQG